MADRLEAVLPVATDLLLQAVQIKQKFPYLEEQDAQALHA